MNIKLPSDQQKWLEDQVAAGRFDSVDEGLFLAVANLMVTGSDDLEWAKPYVEQARASVARGEVISGEDYLKRLDGKIERLRSK